MVEQAATGELPAGIGRCLHGRGSKPWETPPETSLKGRLCSSRSRARSTARLGISSADDALPHILLPLLLLSHFVIPTEAPTGTLLLDMLSMQTLKP